MNQEGPITAEALDRILPHVTRPARYTGGEWNSVLKDWDSTEVRLALVFPDLYEVGMSNMGLSILYELINAQPYVLAERAYTPWPDMEAAGVSEEAIDSLVHRVRERLRQAGATRQFIVTVRGQGYRLDLPGG